MTASSDGGHGPKYGCNYRHCGNPGDPFDCPFTADEHPAVKLIESLPAFDDEECRHDWLQFWIVDDNTPTAQPFSKPEGFYCAKCLLHHD